VPHVLMVSQPTVAGVAQCVLDWSAGLEADGWQVSVAAPPLGELLRWCADAGIPAHSWEAERSPYAHVVAETRALRRIVATLAPDIVVLHSSKAGLDGRLMLRGRVPTVFVPHAWSFDAATGAARRAALMWERVAARRWTDSIICVSTAEYRRGEAMGVKARYHIARNGVDLAAVRLATGRGDRTALRADLGIAPETRLVVCLGRLTTQKGQDVLLRAWSQLPPTGDRRLVIVGEGPDEAMLRGICDADAQVAFAGGVDRRSALRWLAAADLVVVPSRWEGMALVPLEALAVGTPVVASDVTGVNEAVDASVGSLVPPDEPAQLAAAMTQWLRKTDRELDDARVRAQRKADVELSMATTIGAVQEALRATLAARAGR
jgi:glycosyltransferase involved in cell wall biosynthesis